MDKPLTTYQKARLQVVAYRSIQSTVNGILTEYGINTSQWIIMGWLHDDPVGLRITTLAEVLQVETPLITALVQALRSKGYVTVVADPTDKRAKKLALSSEGDKLVEQIEAHLSKGMEKYETDLTPQMLDDFYAVLARFISAGQPPKD